MKEAITEELIKELNNYEYCYTGDVTQAMEAVKRHFPNTTDEEFAKLLIIAKQKAYREV